MKVFTIDDIKAWEPCYRPETVVPSDWSGTVLDMLAQDHMSIQDRLWTVLREECVSEATMRDFVRRFGNLINPDKVVNLRLAARHAASWYRTQANQRGLKRRTLLERIGIFKAAPPEVMGRGIVAVAQADEEMLEFLRRRVKEENDAEA